METILFVGGGSVGHIAPAVAVWSAYLQKHPQDKAHFICTPRPDDAAFLRAQILPFTIVNAPRLSLWYPLKIWAAIRKSREVLTKIQPDILFTTGGYLSIPLCFVAKKMGIPIILHESDSVSGNANKIINRWASHISEGFPSTQKNHHVPHTYTGNPLRPDITSGEREEGLRITGLSGKRPILLVTGGSQGSAALNNAIADHLDDLILRTDIIHITGRGKSLVSHLKSLVSPHYYQTEFANEELKHFYACSDIALSRAGAGSIGELSANGIPTILVPLRYVGHDHQYHNAKTAAAVGGCIYLEQSDLEAQLVPTVHNLVTNKNLRNDMADKIQSFSHAEAALHISDIIAQTLAKAPSDQ